MVSTKKSLFKIVKSNQDLISWRLKKSFSEYEIGLWTIFGTLLIFFIGVIFLNFILKNRTGIDINLIIPVILNLLILFIDTTVISITFNWQIQNKHLSIPDGELFRKRKQIILLFVLIILILGIFIYWVPKITTSIVNDIIYVIVLVVVLIILSINHLLTWFMANFTLAMFKGNDIITINYKYKFIKKEKGMIWNKSIETTNFDELTSLSVRPIEIRKIPYQELILICNEKSFQIQTGTEKFLTDYATQLQQCLNLPMEIPR